MARSPIPFASSDPLDDFEATVKESEEAVREFISDC